MLPTPSTSHVAYDTIYEPAEDSFLLLDTLSDPSESAWLQSRLGSRTPAPLIAEIGTGSGVVIGFATAHAHSIFGRGDVLALGIDVNGLACKATRKTVHRAIEDFSPQKKHPVYSASICSDLTTSLLPHLIDVLIFNPPYVPTEDLPALPDTPADSSPSFEASSHLLALSYAGGKLGMETTDRFLSLLPQSLSVRGVAYLLLCASNKPDLVKASIAAWGGGWNAETVKRSGKQAGWEKLEIVRIWRTVDK